MKEREGYEILSRKLEKTHVEYVGAFE